MIPPRDPKGFQKPFGSCCRKTKTQTDKFSGKNILPIYCTITKAFNFWIVAIPIPYPTIYPIYY